MPLKKSNLGYVLCHVYDFPFGGAIYLPCVERYEVDTPCIVAWGDNDAEAAEAERFPAGIGKTTGEG
ncbi:unnamed protein product [Gemmata massiliana]|uniref:Uncharacterized protein n=1 Tax=Gemmata massiliana TaxID=1210884 RepID=A0A6P2CZC9_9BACT|nr:hypothetical protein [Gemmata massiliana]VTR94341.1 unnamed protein product [Gemmata massiliana]